MFNYNREVIANHFCLLQKVPYQVLHNILTVIEANNLFVNI